MARMNVVPPSAVTQPSCLTCPSLLKDSNEAANFFGKSIGASVCARFGKVIGNSDSTPEELSGIALKYAVNCSSHGLARPAKVNWPDIDMTVAFPDPHTIGQTQVNSDAVTSCLSCEHFVPDDVMVTEKGWAAGMCAAKGKLLLRNRLTFEARHCYQRSFGTNRWSTAGVVFLPEYEPGFNGKINSINEHFKNKAEFVDPVDYETDKPVSSKDTANGIRAWRKVSDVDTDNFVHLPIYRIDFFSEVEQKKIPRTGSDEHPENYVDHAHLTYKVAVLWTELDETPIIWGQPGMGKTEFFRYMAWLMCLPFERFSITESTELDDLAGKMHFTPEKGTHYKYGRLPVAWSKPCVIDVDEPNTARPEVWQFLRPLTDNSKQLVLDMNEGEHLDRHLDCYLGLAANPAWDMRNIGAHQISGADADRLIHFELGLPPDAIEQDIIKTACNRDGFDISSDQIKTVMGIAKDIRAVAEVGTLNITWGIRPQLKAARLLRWFSPMTAYRMACADYLEPEAREVLLECVRAHDSSDPATFLGR